METSISSQAAAMGLAALIGALLGLAYDLLGLVRRRVGKVAAVLLDFVFSLLSGAAAFIYAMGAGEGRLGICQLGAMTAGFLIYIYTAGERLAGVINGSKKKKRRKNSKSEKNTLYS